MLKEGVREMNMSNGTPIHNLRARTRGFTSDQQPGQINCNISNHVQSISNDRYISRPLRSICSTTGSPDLYFSISDLSSFTFETGVSFTERIRSSIARSVLC